MRSTAEVQIMRVEPAYKQVAAWLREQILTGALPDGAVLPSVRRLAHDLGIATTTAREALRLLRHEGLADVIPGVATVARSPQVQKEAA